MHTLWQEQLTGSLTACWNTHCSAVNNSAANNCRHTPEVRDNRVLLNCFENTNILDRRYQLSVACFDRHSSDCWDHSTLLVMAVRALEEEVEVVVDTRLLEEEEE